MSIQLETGNQATVSSASDAELYARMITSENVVMAEPLTLSMSNANTLVVGSGNLLHNGRHVRLKGNTEFTIPSGVQGQKRANLAMIKTTITRDENTLDTVEKSEAIVLSGDPVTAGTPADPAYTQGNLLEGDTVAYFPIARVITDGINAQTPVPLFKVQKSAADAWDSISLTITDKINLRVFGRVCVITVFAAPFAKSENGALLGTVPEKYAPKTLLRAPARSESRWQASQVCLTALQINTSGNIFALQDAVANGTSCSISGELVYVI